MRTQSASCCAIVKESFRKDWLFVHDIEKKIKIPDFSQEKGEKRKKTTQNRSSVIIAQLVRILGTVYVIGHCLCHCLSGGNLGTAYKVHIEALLIY